MLKIMSQCDDADTLTREQKFQVFCRVCDNMLKEGRMTKATHKRFHGDLVMNEYEFWNESTDETIEVEFDGFEEASNIMFGDGEYDYMDWKLISVNGHVSF